MISTALIVILTFVSPQSKSDSLPSVPLPPELASVLRDYEAAWGSRDAQALAILFAEDGFVLPRNNLPIRGREGIRRHYEGRGGPLFLRALAFRIEGSVAYIIGGYSGEQGKPDDGKFTLTLAKNSDGRWEIFSDMDNGNRR